jgi:large subunit ribosomal protein L18
MGHLNPRTAGRYARHRRLRKKVVGLPQRPRLCVFRSHKHLYVQLVDDLTGKTLLGLSTRDKAFKGTGAKGTVSAAAELGKLVAATARQQGIAHVVFDRGGHLYHGRVKALAEAVRAGGLHV